MLIIKKTRAIKTLLLKKRYDKIDLIERTWSMVSLEIKKLEYFRLLENISNSQSVFLLI